MLFIHYFRCKAHPLSKFLHEIQLAVYHKLKHHIGTATDNNPQFAPNAEYMAPVETLPRTPQNLSSFNISNVPTIICDDDSHKHDTGYSPGQIENATVVVKEDSVKKDMIKSDPFIDDDDDDDEAYKELESVMFSSDSEDEDERNAPVTDKFEDVDDNADDDIFRNDNMKVPGVENITYMKKDDMRMGHIPENKTETNTEMEFKDKEENGDVKNKNENKNESKVTDDINVSDSQTTMSNTDSRTTMSNTDSQTTMSNTDDGYYPLATGNVAGGYECLNELQDVVSDEYNSNFYEVYENEDDHSKNVDDGETDGRSDKTRADSEYEPLWSGGQEEEDKDIYEDIDVVTSKWMKSRNLMRKSSGQEMLELVDTEFLKALDIIVQDLLFGIGENDYFRLLRCIM